MSEIIKYLSFSVWLIPLSIIPSKSIHTVTNSKIFIFLWLSSVSLYIYTTSSLSFICQRALRFFLYLGCVNNTTVSIEVYISFELIPSYFSDKYQVWNSWIISVFWGISILFLQWLHQFAFPPTIRKGSLSLHPNTCCFLSFFFFFFLKVSSIFYFFKYAIF